MSKKAIIVNFVADFRSQSARDIMKRLRADPDLVLMSFSDYCLETWRAKLEKEGLQNKTTTSLLYD